jgi:hypothetical protein
MPSSVPGSGLEFGETCNWCKTGYPNYQPKGEKRLGDFLEVNRNSGDGADCLVGVSGGKDSSYAALELKTTYGQRVEAFTYTHDGLTVTALENARRVCRELNIEQHLVALENHGHLKSFISYFKTWIKSPKLISAAMTCVACKHLHLQGTRLAARRRIPMVVWANCPLENPPFLALRPQTAEGAYEYKRENIVKAAGRLLNQAPSLATALAKHPKTSLLGCLCVTPSSKYLGLRYPGVKHLFFYDFIRWDPIAIVEKLSSQVSWVRPKAPDDWHSDCLFNVFKEYMFQSMFQASYTDAFLSNQVRCGMFSRQEAWGKLLASKKYFASELPPALKAVGLESLQAKMNLGCFDIEE